MIELRKYRPEDIEEMTQLFYHTVHTINAADYTEEQLDAWADGKADKEKWNQSFLSHSTWVAVEGQKIVGFADMDEEGYLDRLYVHKDFQGMGIASRLCDQLEGESSSLRFFTHASITARPFFEKRGYRVERQQQVERKGVWLTNYLMVKRKDRA